jgi:hypothetical protein
MSKNKNFLAHSDILSDILGVLGTSSGAMFSQTAKSKERQPSTAKLQRAALATLRPLRAWATRDRHLK